MAWTSTYIIQLTLRLGGRKENMTGLVHSPFEARQQTLPLYYVVEEEQQMSCLLPPAVLQYVCHHSPQHDANRGSLKDRRSDGCDTNLGFREAELSSLGLLVV